MLIHKPLESTFCYSLENKKYIKVLSQYKIINYEKVVSCFDCGGSIVRMP